MRFSDLEDLYQDFSGTPVTEVGQPVGLVLDKSQSQTLGSELVSNGNFDLSSTDWTDVLGNSTYEFYRATLYLSSGELSQKITVDPEKVYRLTANITAPLGGKALTFGSASSSEERSTISIPRETRKVFIALGQSNLDGFSVSLGDPEVPTEYFGSQPYCKSWQPQSLNSSSGSWTTLNTFLKHTVTRYDSAVYNLHRYSPISVPNYDLLLPLMKDIAEFETGPGRPEEPVYLIKNTHPSTFMVSGLDAPWNNLSWTDQSGPVANVQGSGLYFTLINDVSAAIESLRSGGQEESDIEIAGIFVMQGESEAGSTYPAQSNYPNPEDIPGAWGQYFRLFYSNLQRDLKAILYGEGSSADDLPVYLARTHYFLNTGGNYAYTDIVREQQESVASDPTLNVTLVDIDEIDHFGDANKVHFDGSGLTSVAGRFYSEYFDDWNVKRNSFWESQSIAFKSHFIPDSSSLYISLHSPETDPDAAIADLFAEGEEGAWYDPSDQTTVFTNFAGQFPASAGDPVGLLLDKSKGLVLGEEIAVIDSSGWTTGNGASLSSNESILQITNTLNANGNAVQVLPTEAGKWYKASWTAGGTFPYVRIYSQLATLNVVNVVGESQLIFKGGNGTSVVLYSNNPTIGSTATYENFSVKELPGNHAYQITSTARPVLQESGGKYYLDFDGVDDYLEAIYTSEQPQPNTLSIAAKADSNSGALFDGAVDINKRHLYYIAAGVFQAFAGGDFLSGISADTDTHIHVCKYDAALSYIRTDAATVASGNAGTRVLDGITLGAYYNGAYRLDGRIYSFVGVNRTLTSDETADLETYLATKSGVTGIPAPELYPNTFDNISLKEVAGFHAKQPTSTARPVVRESNGSYYLEFDGVDDRLLVEVPGQVRGTAVISDVLGTASYGVSIPSGTFSIGTNSPSVNFSFNDNLLGMLVRNNAMSSEEIDTAFQYFREGGASAIGASAYGDVIDFNGYWRNADWITDFPLIDTTSATSFYAAWFQCTNLRSLPILNTSNVINLRSAFSLCTSLSSFPLIDTSQVNNIGFTWSNCTSLSSFPLLDTGSVTDVTQAWKTCYSLSSFPLIDTSQVVFMSQAWRGCSNLSSFPLIDTSQVADMRESWTACSKLTSFPQIDTGNVTLMSGAWNGCQSLSSFPLIDTTKVNNFNYTWYFCSNLSSFPQIDCLAATSLARTWMRCDNLEHFPSGVFDNTSGTVDFTDTFTNTKLNSQSVDNVLLSINNANTASGIINLDSTNMQAPGVGGTYAKHRLESRGWTVNTKPVSDDVIVSSIFYTGQYGTWYDVNDLNTLFEDVAGTIPVTGAGQPVGLMLDKSQGLILGEELVTNGTFDTDTSGWVAEGSNTISAVGGELEITFNSAFFTGANSTYSTPLVVGKYYKLVVTARKGTTPSNFTVRAGAVLTSEQITFTSTSNETKELIFLATAATTGPRVLTTITSASGTAYIDNITVRELPGNHARQPTSTARPILQGSAGDYHLDFDQVDDRLLVDVSGFNGTAYIPTEEGSVAYGVAIPSGTYALGTNTTGVTYSFAKELVGGIITDTPMLAPEIGALDQFFAARGAGPYGASAYGGVTNLYQYWRNADWITEFPLIDSSQVTIFRDAWSYCYNLRSFPELNSSAVTSLWSSWAKCYSLSSFPLIDTSQVTDFMEAWGQCYSLSSFPLIDTSKGTRFQQAWWTCSSLTSFPAINTSAGTNFTQTWNGCTNLTDFPLIDTSQALAIDRTWNNCYSLTSFPAINTSAATHFNQAWSNCNSLSSFPLIDTSQATSLYSTWYSCTSLADFPLIDTSQVTSLISTWFACRNLSSFPLIDTSQVTDMYYTWNGCKILANFPEINTSAVTRFQRTWFDCDGLSSFPAIDCRSATNLDATWYGAGNLESFPAGVFDNTSGTVDFSNTFYGTKLNSQSVDNVIVSVNNANTSAGILTLNSAAQGMQAPTASGLLAADYLYDRGWTLNLVGGYTPLDTRVSSALTSINDAWFEVSLDYLYEDSSGTIPVTGVNSPIGLVVDRNGATNNLYQNTSTARPVLQQDASSNWYIAFDKVDDTLLITSALEGQATIATDGGIATFGVKFTDNHSLIRFQNFYYPGINKLYGLIAKQGKFTDDEKTTVTGKLLRSKPDALVNEQAYGNFTSLLNRWTNADWITEFPLIDTSQVTSLNNTWYRCTNLSSFPLIDTSQVTNFAFTWQGCKLSSFPEINTSAGTYFKQTWMFNPLTSFPLLDFRSAVTLDETWKATAITDFPQINTSSVLSIPQCWNGCSNLSSFPLLDFSNVTSMNSAWMSCPNLLSFPPVNTSSVISLGRAWRSCTSLSSFPLIDTAQTTNMYETWYGCGSLSSFPLIDTSQVTSLAGTWMFCGNLASFPSINTSAAESFSGAWRSCGKLISFPQIDCRSATALDSTWLYCTSLEVFPAGVFDNTSGTTNFSNTFQYTKLNSQSVDNVIISINNANTSSGTLDLATGSQQPPSYWGIAASGELESRGWNVLTITPTAEDQLDATIAPLYFSGDVGAWYDPSDFDTMFEAPNSNTFPVTGAGQPVGLILDKSKGLQLSNELIGDTWSFNDAGWSQVGDTLVSVSGGQFGVYQLILETGKAYSISFEVFDYESGAVRPRLGSQAEPIGPPYITANGVYTATCICKGSTAFYFMGNLSFVGKIRNISVRELPGNHAYQETSTARPLLAVDVSGNYYLDGDGVDDYLQATMPEVIGKKIVASPEGIVEYGVHIPSGTHILLRNSIAQSAEAHPDIYGEITTTNPFDTNISSTVYQYLTDKGAGPSGVDAFSGTTTLSMRWRQNLWITDFPIIDTSQVTSLYYTWENCLNLSSFPLIDTSQVTNMQAAWQNCQNLISMPQIDTSKTTTMAGAWNQCYNLTSFPQIETSALLSIGLGSAWRLCQSMISFPFIETGHITNFGACWQDCYVLSSFPLIDTSQGTNFNYTWRNNRALSSFPLIDTSQTTSLYNTWNGCYGLSSFPAINTSAVTSLEAAWAYCISLSSFPLIDTSQVTNLAQTWNNCRELKTFPEIDTSQATNLSFAWFTCRNLSSFPQIDCRSATNLTRTWDQCINLEVFPSGVFDNTSGTTNFSETFRDTKLNTQSIDNVLLSVNNANTSDGTITLNSTNMQTPGVGGTYAKHQLENRGWTVNTKAVTNDVVVSSVFFEGESAWYDVNDLTTLYQNWWGTIPVTTAGQPVGLMLDKSKGLELGPDLITNGTFDTDTDWVKSTGVTISGGVASFDGTHGQTLTQNIGATGKFYEITLDVVSTNSTGVFEVYHINLGGPASFDISTTGTKTVRLHGGTTYTDGRFSLRGRSGFVGSIDNVIVKEIAGNHAYQHTSTARPVLQGSAGDYYLDFDGVDDRLLVDSPGFTGTAYIADELGSAAYGIAIPSGTYSIGTNTTGVNYSFAKDIVGEVLLDRPMLAPELGALQTYFDDLGAGPYGASAYGSVINLYQYWRNADWITDFPLIDTSQVTNFGSSWYGCTSLTDFPLIDTSKGTSMFAPWFNCYSLTSFPLIELKPDTAVDLRQAWYGCSSLTSFPAINTSALTSLQQNWTGCRSLSSFPLLDTRNVQSLFGSWENCFNLSSFPLIDTSKVTHFGNTWYNCRSLSSMPEINTSAATRMDYTWMYCYGLSSFPLLDTGNVTNFYRAWRECTSLTSFPAINTQSATNISEAFFRLNSLSSFPWIDTSQVTNFRSAWFACSNLKDFPAINTSAATDFRETWNGCTSLSSFPPIDTSQVTNMYFTWGACYNLSSFPLIDTSQVTDMRLTWYDCNNLTTFPAIDAQSVTSFDRTWYSCDNLEHFPAGVFDNTSATTDFSLILYNTKLNTQSVDNVLVSINNADTSSGTLNLNSTNMQPPSYWGIVASGLLEDRGWTVSTKTPTTQALEDSEIASLFFSGDEGAWYDPSDFTTMFEDYQGTIPVTGTGQPVGLILDKSKGLQLGNNVVGNGTFDASSGWSLGTDWVISGGVAQNITGGTGLLQPNVATLTIGKWYKITFDLVATSGRMIFRPNAGAAADQIEFNTSGSKTLIFSATAEFMSFRELSGSAGTIIDNVVIQELPGNHAYQQTSTARPSLEVDDITGKYYLDFDGVDDYLKTGLLASPITQPASYLTAFKANNQSSTNYLWDGSTGRHAGIKTLGIFALYAGAQLNSNPITFTSANVISTEFNTVNSNIYVNGVFDISGNAGTQNLTELFLGSRFSETYLFGGAMYGFMMIEKSLSPTERSTVESYLASKSGVTL